MKRPDSIDIGTQMDIAKYRLQTAKEDLDTAELTYEAKQFHATIRHASDYDTFYIASKEITAQQIQTAKQFLALATEYLENTE